MPIPMSPNNEIGQLLQQQERHGEYHQEQGFNSFGNCSKNVFVEKSGLAKDNEDNNPSEQVKNRCMTSFNTQNMMGPLGTLSVNLGSIGSINLVSYASSADEMNAVKTELEAIAQNPELSEKLAENLEHASADKDGNMFATYEDQFKHESDFGTSCSIDTSGAALATATTDPNSYEAANFSMLKGETPNMSPDLDFNFGQGTP